MIDLTLNSILIPDITGYTPPFGTKITRTPTNRGGLSTLETNNNIIASFTRMRPVIVDGTDLTTSAVEYDARLSITATSSVTLVLGTPTYIGCKVTVVNSSNVSHVISHSTLGNLTILTGESVNLLWTGAFYCLGDSSIAIARPSFTASVPSGYLACNGDTITAANYPRLYEAIGGTLPDMRECVPVGIGHNSTNVFDATETDPSTGSAGKQAHDEYTLGQFKDDQMQRITGCVGGMDDGQPYGAFYRDTERKMSAGFGNGDYRATTKMDSSLVTRGGTTTHGKQIGVNWIIKAF